MSWPVITGIAPRWESALATLLGSSQQAHLVRRCADVAELVGVARAGLARAALISSDLRGLDRDVVTALQDAGVHIVGIQPPHDEDGARRLRRWGVLEIVATDVSVQDLDLALAALEQPAGEGAQGVVDQRQDKGRRGRHSADLSEISEGGRLGEGQRPAESSHPVRGTVPSDDPSHVRDEQSSDERDSKCPPEEFDRSPSNDSGRDFGGQWGEGPTAAEAEDSPSRPPRGEVVVIWGAYGSPGRTSVAVNVAAELASPVQPVILVDADTYAASIAQWLAVLDEAPGIAAAARAADHDTLDAESLHRIAPQVRPGLSVLTGLPRADRWPELGEAAFADVLEQCREVARWVVVDVAPVAEQDEELSFDTSAPRRNGATLTALQAADRVVVVGVGDPVGLHRLVRCLDAFPQLSAGIRDVVVNRVRPGPVGPEPERRIRESLARFAGTDTVHLIPDDPDSLDAALLHGRLLLEVRPGSTARHAIQELAASIRGSHRRSRAARSSWGARLLRRG